MRDVMIGGTFESRRQIPMIHLRKLTPLLQEEEWNRIVHRSVSAEVPAKVETERRANMTMRFMRLCGVSVLLLCFLPLACLLPSAAQEVIPHRQDRPPNQPHAPEEAVRRMTVPDGFTVELVAAEPDVVNPIAMTFDDRGRIWVTESLEYPRKSAGVGRDRIKILEDTRGSGRADKVTTFVEGLNIPTGIAIGYGGIWVLNAPDLLFFTEKDGKAIRQEVILTGFGRADTHELPNSLTWGPDGWLYGLNGVFNPCHIVSSDKTFDFTCALWRLHPRTREFQVFCEGTSNPWGLVWDPEGSALVSACHWANDHVFHFVETGYYQRQAGPYPPYTMPIGSSTNHSHQKTAYCGLCYFDSDAYPERYRGRLYMGNIHGGCINVDVLRREGSSYLSNGEPDFLTAHDAWFMPVAQKVGPDGCLYILDWYDRYHCYQDASRDAEGVDRLRGRLYRVRYRNTPRAPHFDLSRENEEQLVQRLASPNLYFREAAQRLLTERNTPSLRARLQALVWDESTSRRARLHALWALIGTGSLDTAFHERLLSHTDSTYRAWGVRAAGNFRKVVRTVQEKVATMAGDRAPDVQLQVAIAARKIQGLDALPILVDVLASCGQDKLIPAIVWPNLHPLLEEQGPRFVRLVEAPDWHRAAALTTLMPRVIERLLSRHRADAASVAQLLELVISRDPNCARQTLSALARKSDEMDTSLRAALQTRLQPVLKKILTGRPTDPLFLSAQLLAARWKVGPADAASVRRLFVSADQSQTTRLDALEVLIAFHDPSLFDSLAHVLAVDSPSFVSQVLAALGRWDEPKVAQLVLAAYPKLAPEVQPLAIDLLLQRRSWTQTLLHAVLDRRLPASVLNANHLQKILDGNDREAIWAVEKAWGTVRKERNPEREKVVALMGQFLRQHPGDAKAGAHVFKKVCAQCHAIYGQGAQVGPDLTGNGRDSFEQLLSNVFDPSLVIGPGYQATTVVTKDGRFLTGLVTEDNEQRILLKLPGGVLQTIARGNIEYVKASPLSLMPEGMEKLLDRNELSDLFAFLTLDKPPDDPRARPIPGAPGHEHDVRIQLEKGAHNLILHTRFPGKKEWSTLLTYVTDPALPPHVHALRDPSGRVVLTEDRSGESAGQEGIFAAFPRLNGIRYGVQGPGQQHFARLLDLKEAAEHVSWRALAEWIAPDGHCMLQEEQAFSVAAPHTPESYIIDLTWVLRATHQDLRLRRSDRGGLAVRMACPASGPRVRYFNANKLQGRGCDQQQAAWCAMERPFGQEVFGIAVLDHPGNANHPPGWWVDEQGLLSPSLTLPGDWSLKAGKERVYRYRIVVYKGPGSAALLRREWDAFR
jgi:putative heme-binding domain-containing protein